MADGKRSDTCSRAVQSEERGSAPVLRVFAHQRIEACHHCPWVAAEYDCKTWIPDMNPLKASALFVADSCLRWQCVLVSHPSRSLEMCVVRKGKDMG